MLKETILQLLREKDAYVSGQDLCERLGVTRTAVWKAVGKLKEEGYDIRAVRNRGYRLFGEADVLNAEELASEMKGNPLIPETEFYKRLDSTNQAAKEGAEKGKSMPRLYVADEQTAGRGRRGRTWVSPPGTGIWMSVLLKPQLSSDKAAMLTLVAALAVAEGIRRETGLSAGIKWPNDIVIGGRKVCGILTEMSADMDGIRYVVVGIGINANTETFPAEIRKTATSLRMETGRVLKRSALIGAVMREFAGFYESFVREESLKGLREQYEALLVNRGRAVTVLDPAGEYTGTAEGITDTGELLVRTENNTVRKILSGEVSVRGIYGYI